MTVILIPFFVCSCASITKSVPFLAKKDDTSSVDLNNAEEAPVQENTQPTQSLEPDETKENTGAEEETELA